MQKTAHGRGAMYRAIMKRCCLALTLLAFFCKCAEGFVVVNQGPRARLTEGGGSHRDMIRAAQVGAPSSLTPPTRRRRGRGSSQQGQHVNGGGASLRVGMNMPSVELVAGFLDGPLATILEQSARHHYPSAFIGGTVGVLGTLTAIQVCACVCRV